MKNLFVLILFAATVFSFSAAAQNWKVVYFDFHGSRAQASFEDFRRFTVCDLKIPASKQFGLNPYKFELKVNGLTLSTGKTLDKFGFRHGIVVEVVPVKATRQCAGQYPGFKS